MSVAQAPQLEEPPAWMRASCAKLDKLAEREPSQEEVEGDWGSDTQVYERCRIRHAALRNFYRKRDEALRGNAVKQP